MNLKYTLITRKLRWLVQHKTNKLVVTESTVLVVVIIFIILGERYSWDLWRNQKEKVFMQQKSKKGQTGKNVS